MTHYRPADPFLRRKLLANSSQIEGVLRQWGMPTTFLEPIDRWFSNFPADLKELAYNVFLNIDYYGEARFFSRITELRDIVVRTLLDEGFNTTDLILVTPSGGGDSAHRHAYDLTKAWRLPRDQVYSISDLASLNLTHKFIVLFNDTYGSGRQFLEMAWPFFAQLPSAPRGTFIVGISIARKAFEKFKKLPDVWVVPDSPIVSAREIFSESDLRSLTDIGRRVYPKHPLGFGDCALLTAYYFQCPNNSLPIIWADGNNNSPPEERSYPWSPLFVYRPKVRSHMSSLIRPNGPDGEPSEPSERQRLLNKIEDLRRDS